MSKTAIVTGGSGGIGRAVVHRLASDGFTIVVHYSGNAQRAEEVVKEVACQGGQAIAIAADIGDQKAVAALFTETKRSFATIDVVVNTAGIMPLSPIETGNMETFDKVIETNLRGTFLIMSQAAQHVSKGGRIIVFSSSVLAKSFPNYGPYIASKAGVEGLVPVLANELRGREITVNAIAPGPVVTPLFLMGKSNEQIEGFKKMAPLERLGQPEDIAGIVSFLAGPDGAWVQCPDLAGKRWICLRPANREQHYHCASPFSKSHTNKWKERYYEIHHRDHRSVERIW
jgi:3-oxoacyl-[acyl-carrier protein] reductase